METEQLEEEPFEPDWAVAPGRSIWERLEGLNLTMGDFAEEVELTRDQATALLDGLHPISDDLAERLARVVGGSTTFWTRRERQFLASLERLGRTREGHARREREKEHAWKLIEAAVLHPGDPTHANLAMAEIGALLDALHDEVEAAGRP